MSWFVYMVRCADSSFYTGITKDVEKRVAEHNNHIAGAKYTRGRRPVKLIYSEASESRSTASKREHEIKQLSKSEKAALVLGGSD
jgi:putative endonuclease